MPHHILILDDDADFNNLLTSVFKNDKAGYKVTSCQDPQEALNLFEKEDLDLIVADHRMPKITGLEFVERIRSHHPSMPVIVVSAFLDNQSARGFINLGVNAIFLKPLNVFSLLDKTHKILTEVGRKPSKVEDKNADETVRAVHQQEYFRTFPCRDPKTKALEAAIKSKQHFKSSLLLIGKEGAPFKEIIDDLRALNKNNHNIYIHLLPSKLDASSIKKQVDTLVDKETETLTFVIPPLNELTPEQIVSLEDFLHNKGQYLPEGLAARFIYSLHNAPDELLEKNIINEELYLLLGNNEINIPPITKCLEDLTSLAHQFIRSYCLENDLESVPDLDDSAIEYIHNYNWPGDYAEFKNTIYNAVKHSDGVSITEDDLTGMVSAKGGPSMEVSLKMHLENIRNDYVKAVYHLVHHDVDKVCTLLSCEHALVNDIIKSNA